MEIKGLSDCIHNIVFDDGPTVFMRDYEESPPRMMHDMDDLDDDPNEGRSNMDEWFPEDGSNDRD
jgi:hypothetical protein